MVKKMKRVEVFEECLEKVRSAVVKAGSMKT
jgi:hypothetical protein